jgi:serine/threonine-protein kinase HipA
MTMLGGVDGGQFDYIELAEAISDHGSSVRRDLEELWRRIAFSIAIHNTDDHMRNHGFLWAGSGWELSPAFDMNPNPIAASSRSTFIGYQNLPEHELLGLMDSAKNFQIDQARANEIWSEVVSGVSKWRQVATSYTIPASEQKRFAPVLDKYLSA